MAVTLVEPVIHARARMRPFLLERPTTLADAVELLASSEVASHPMAGGIDIVNAMKCGIAFPRIVHLAGLPLRRVEVAEDSLVIGAMVRHGEIETASAVAATIPDLAGIVRDLGNVRVRTAGTIGGNIMAAHRYYDWLPIVMALDGQVTFVDPRGTHQVSSGDLVTEDGRWSLPPGLLTEIRIPRAGDPAVIFVRRLKPVISVAVGMRRAGRRCDVRVAVGCMHEAPIVRKLPDFEAAAIGVDADAVDAIGRAFAASLPDAHDDGLAGGSYRRLMAAVLVSRALRGMLGTDVTA